MGDGPSTPIVADTIGRGALEFVSQFDEAAVGGVFEHGFYLSADDQVIAVVDQTISNGPLYVRHDTSIVAPPVGTEIGIGETIHTASADLYQPDLPEPGAGMAILAEIEAPVPDDIKAKWAAVEAGARVGDRRRVRDLIVGLGRGLTPEGDDVLAGAFMVWALDRSARQELADLAAGAATTNLSRAFLRWAAAGQSVVEVHDLLSAAATGRRTDLAVAQQRVRNFGHTSGAAMLAGIKLAARCGPHQRCPATSDVPLQPIPAGP